MVGERLRNGNSRVRTTDMSRQLRSKAGYHDKIGAFELDFLMQHMGYGEDSGVSDI